MKDKHIFESELSRTDFLDWCSCKKRRQSWSVKSGGPADGDPQGSSLEPTSQYIHSSPGWGAEEWGEKIYISCEVAEGIRGVKSCREVWYWVNWAIKWQLKVILSNNSDKHGEEMDFSHVEWWGPADLAIQAWTWSQGKWMKRWAHCSTMVKK